jgi:signal transduction histidine kinase
MVKQLAELQGGAVAVASLERAGSRFAVWLPLRTTPGTAPVRAEHYLARDLIS